VTNEANSHRKISNLYDVKLRAIEELAKAGIDVILVVTIVVDYFAGLLIERTRGAALRWRYLVTSIVVTCGVLFVFKYYNFFGTNVNWIADQFKLHKTKVEPEACRLLADDARGAGGDVPARGPARCRFRAAAGRRGAGGAGVGLCP